MSPTSNPSVPDLLPKPSTVPTVPQHPQPLSVVPLESPGKLIARMSILAGSMKSRPATGSLFKVIAVDGADRHAVHGMIATLQHRITRDLRYFVRVMGEDSFYPPFSQPTQLSHFIRRVESWGAMWEMILHAPPNFSNPVFYNGSDKPAPTHPEYTIMPPDYPTVYILPLSPLMATLHALGQAADLKDPWHVLCSYWKDSFRPDLTVNIGDITNSHCCNEVIRFQGTGMNAIVLTKEGGPGLNATPQQMRRVVFEVEEWIRW